jgi:sugar phosphate isomerase/epimerase
MTVSCSTLCCDKEQYPDIEDAVGKIAGLGFEAVDLGILENWQHYDPSALVEDADGWGDRFAEAVQRHGLAVSSLNCGPSRSLLDPESAAFEQYKRQLAALLDLAEKVECPNITLQPGRLSEGQTLDDALPVLADHVAQIGAMAGKREVAVSLEGHQGTVFERPPDALGIIRDCWPEVGYTYDPSHLTMLEIPLQESEELLRYTYHVHVRNAAVNEMQAGMDEGEVDFGWLIPALARAGYKGALAIEYFRGFDGTFENTLALKALLERLLSKT